MKNLDSNIRAQGGYPVPVMVPYQLGTVPYLLRQVGSTRYRTRSVPVRFVPKFSFIK